MKMPTIPIEPERDALPSGMAVCHLYDPRTSERLCSCPCATLDIAITIAQTNLETLNFVEGLGHYSAWRNGEQFYISTTPATFAAWKQEHIKPKTNDHQNSGISNQRQQNPRDSRRRAEARDCTSVS